MADGPKENKVAVVTGGALGIGRAICLQLARDGADVAIWDINVAGAEETAGMVRSLGRRSQVYETNVASAAAIAQALERTRADLGVPAILVNNAAMTGAVTFDDMSEEQWDRMVEVDLKGPFLCIKAVLPGMLAARWGRIVNITSSAAHMGSTGMAHYVAAKGGLTALTKALAFEYAASGVTVNNVPPGYIETPTMRGLQASNPFSTRTFEEQIASFPMKRAGKPEDIAGAVSYLVSESANYVSGQTIHVNGARFFG